MNCYAKIVRILRLNLITAKIKNFAASGTNEWLNVLTMNFMNYGNYTGCNPDLFPLHLAGEVSADTHALVERFLLLSILL